MLSATQPDEVVEVFLGDTLEEAMSRAVARLGPDLTVRRARKVRKGVQGLVGKDRFEVVAVPAPRGDEQVVEGAFEALLQQAEEAEGVPPSRTAGEEPLLQVVRPRAVTAPGAPALVSPAPEAPVHQAPLTVPAPRAASEPAPAAPVVPPPVPRARTPRKAPARTAGKAPMQRPQPAGWGAEALRQLGLPRSLLSHLPAREPRTDAQWIAALTKAFAAVVPAAHEPSAQHPAVVDGYGIEGVRAILAAAAKGMTPGRIHYSGRVALATPTELALAVRAEVMS